MNLEALYNAVQVPSVVSSIETSWTRKHNISLDLKRDDLIHPLISGNKFRKLIGYLEKYRNENVRQIATFGGPYSNHLIAVAKSAEILEIPSIGYIRGDHHKFESKLIQLCKKHGMEIHFLTYKDYDEKKHTNSFHEHVLVIPEGGAGELGMLGCAEVLNELNEKYDQIYVAAGTGTTYAGMVKSHIEANVIGVQVLKGDNYLSELVKEKYKISSPVILDEFHMGGYAKTSEELFVFIQEFYEETSILLDPIYTGKMMFAIKQMIESGRILPESKLLAVHTGGLTGWLGMEDKKPRV